jgi:serine protease inhibitor
MSTTLSTLLCMLTPALPQDPKGGPIAIERPAAQANNGFGIDLYRALAKAHPDGNLFLSPYSVTQALLMAAEGARGETASEMLRVLHAASPETLAAVHAGFAALAARFRAGGGAATADVRSRIATLHEQLAAANQKAEKLQNGSQWEAMRAAGNDAARLADQLNELLRATDCYELRTGNSLWVDKRCQLLPTYLAVVDRHYGTGSARIADFAGDAESERARINAWVGQQTHGRITDLLAPGMLSPLTRAVLANAVYFRGEWATPFSASSTTDEAFRRAGGASDDIRLMRDAWRTAGYAAFSGDGVPFTTPHSVPRDPALRPATYPDDRGFTMVELPYKGGDMAMVVLLPRTADGLPHLESLLTDEALAGWLAKLDARTVDTALPRFTLGSKLGLVETLQSLGMRRAFADPTRPDGAQFTGMTGDVDPAQQLYFSNVVHQAKVEVTEVGTEAVAATAVICEVGAAAPRIEMEPFQPVFRADHPFLFLIRDVRSGTVLFLGRMVAAQN